jgi:hypothetical protein
MGLRPSSVLKISVVLVDNEITGLARSPYKRAY